MNTKDIIIDPEIQALIPPLREEERTLLEESLCAEGCRDPLAVWEGHDILLDGHNRKEICERLGLEYDVVEIVLPHREAACDWVDANQLGRRNLTPDQMSVLRGRRYSRRKKAASFENGKSGNSAGRPPANKAGKEQGGKSCHPDKTADSLAKQYGVSPRTIRNDGKYAEAVEKVTEVVPDLPSRIAEGKAPSRKAVVKAARIAETDPEGAKKILAEAAKRPPRAKSGDSPPHPQPDAPKTKRYLSVLMAVTESLSRLRRIRLSDEEKNEFRARVLEKLEKVLNGGEG